MKDNVRDKDYLTVEETYSPGAWEEVLYSEDDSDGYAAYGTNEEGLRSLLYVEEDDDRTFYEIPEGVEAIEAEAFAEQPALRCLALPASLKVIPDGALSNADGWLGEEAGIVEIRVHPANSTFYVEGQMFLQRTPVGTRLLKFLGNAESVTIPGNLASVAEGAFYGCKVQRLYFEDGDAAFELPAENAFYLDEILRGFGRNGKIYDFTEYDSQALREQLNPVRMRMAMSRLTQKYCLSKAEEQRILDRFRNRMENVMIAVDEYNAFPELRLMAEAGIFDQEALEEAIELINRTQQTEMLQYLLNYKHNHFQTEEFDFSI